MSATNRKKNTPIGSFLDAVRAPKSFDDMEVAFKQMLQCVADTADDLSEQPQLIAAFVDDYIFDSEPGDYLPPELRLLHRLKERTYPRVLELLRDPNRHSRLCQLEPLEYSQVDAPICRICKIFEGKAPPPVEAGPLLVPFSKSDHDKIRKSVALIIASIGSAAQLPELRRLLDDHDEYVKSYVLTGLQRAIAGQRIAPESVGEFFRLVSDKWPADTCFHVSEDVPNVLLALDRERAIRRLLADDLFDADFEPVWRILEAFDENQVEIPREMLLRLFASLDVENLKYPHPEIFNFGLPLLADWKNPDDVKLFESLVDHPEESVVQGACKAMYRFYDLTYSWHDLSDQPWDELTIVQRHLVAIGELDMAIRSGGMTSYFFNSYANHAQTALEGLQAIKAPLRHEILLDCVKKFGQQGPATDVRARRQQVSEMVTDNGVDPFEDAGYRWLEATAENLDRLRLRYQLANRPDPDAGSQ